MEDSIVLFRPQSGGAIPHSSRFSNFFPRLAGVGFATLMTALMALAVMPAEMQKSLLRAGNLCEDAACHRPSLKRSAKARTPVVDRKIAPRPTILPADSAVSPIHPVSLWGQDGNFSQSVRPEEPAQWSRIIHTFAPETLRFKKGVHPLSGDEQLRLTQSPLVYRGHWSKDARERREQGRVLAAQMHLWLGEYATDVEEDVNGAQRHFDAVRALVTKRSPLYGRAAFDNGILHVRAGKYRKAQSQFSTLLQQTSDPRLTLCGFDSRGASRWWKFASQRADYHADNGRAGIPEPAHLDPECVASSLSVVLRAHTLPYDRATVLSRLHVTDMGSDMNDLLVASRRFPKLVARPVTADETGLKRLPKPLIAYVENDHYVTVTKTDDKGVTYLCGDCGAWPGGAVKLTWSQWRRMLPGRFIAMTRTGSRSDKNLVAALTLPTDMLRRRFERVALSEKRDGMPVRIAQAGPHGVSASSLGLSGHIAMFAVGAPSVACATKSGPGGNPGNSPPSDGSSGPGDGGGTGAGGGGSGGTSTTGSTGGSRGNGKGGGGGSGPFGGDPVNLTTGEEEYQPASDLVVYNSAGPPVVWRRIYRSLNGGGDWGPPSQFNDYGQGWSHGYHVGVYDPSLTISPQTPRGGTAEMLPGRGSATWGHGAATWVVYNRNTIVSSSTTPNGWSASIFTRDGTTMLSVTPPVTAPLGYSDRIFGVDYRILVKTATAGTAESFFDVTPAGTTAPAGPTTQAGTTKYLYMANLKDIAFTAPSIPTAANPSVVCTPEAGLAVRIEWKYDSPRNQAGYYVIRFSDGTQWTTTTAITGMACYTLSKVQNRMGQGLMLKYSIYESLSKPWPLLTSIVTTGSVRANQTLLTLTRATNGFVTQVSDRYDRKVTYTSGNWGTYNPLQLKTVSQVFKGTTVPTLPRYDYDYTTGLFRFDGMTATTPYLSKITVPSPTDGTSTVSGQIVYNTTTNLVSKLIDSYGNERRFSYPDGTHTQVSSVNSLGEETANYRIAFDGVGNETERLNATGGKYTSVVYGGISGSPYLPDRVVFGNSLPGGGAVLPGDQIQIPANGVNYPIQSNWEVYLNGSRIDGGQNYDTYGPGGWWVSFNRTTDLWTVRIPATAGGSTGYEVRTSYYVFELGRYVFKSATFAVAMPRAQTDYRYDSFGNVLSVTTPRGITTTYTYDYSVNPLGRLTQVQEASRPATTFTYDDTRGGLVKTITAPAPAGSGVATVTSTFAYSPLGNVLSVTSPGNNATAAITTTLNYTSDGAYTKPEALGQPVTVTNSLGKVSHARYDARGNVVQTWDALGNTTDISYNIADQPTQAQFPATGQTGVGRGKVVNTYLYVGGPATRSQVFNENNVVIREVNVTRGTNGEGTGVSGSTETVTPETGSGYHLSRLKDGNAQTTAYDIDEIGALRSVTYPGGDQVRFTRYDRSGNLLERIDGNGAVTQYVYDDVEDLLTDVVYPATPARNVHFVYDYLGRLESKSDGEGTQSYTYGDSDEIVSVTTTYTGLPAKTLTYSYYPNGSRKQTQTPVGTFSYTYDAAGRVAGLTNPAGESTAWDYLDNGWLWKQRQTGGITVGGVPTELARVYTYNALGQMTGLANGLGGNTLSQFAPIVHDGAGNRTSVASNVTGTPSLGGTTTWAYDYKDRLTGETSTRNGGWSAAFGYDGAGNLTTFKGNARTYNINNQLTGGAGLAAFSYDGNGSATTHRGANVGYDAEANATLFGATAAPDLRAGYTSGGLRAWKQSAGGKTYFLYDGAAPIVEMDAAGNALATNTFGPAGLISRKVTGSSTGTTFYAFDERGNTAQRIDAGGNVLSSHVYDAYGVGLSLPASLADPYLFGGQAGYYTDGETGLVLCTFRYYDPQVGRWLTRDPAGYAGGMNLYAYCYGNPTNALDPLGLSPESGPDQWYDKLARFASFGAEQAKSGVFDSFSGHGGAGIATSTVATSAIDLVAGALSLPASVGHLGEGSGRFAASGGGLLSVEAIGMWEDVGTASGVMLAGVAATPTGGAAMRTPIKNNCFVAGTPVQMADGTTKSVEEVRADDWVKSRDEATGKDVAKRVLRTFVNEAHGTLLTLRFDSGEEVTTTAGHPFFVEGRGFVLAGELGIGTAIVTRAGPHTASTVASVTRHIGKRAAVYNFEVEGTHTYFVGKNDGGVWVHNQSGEILVAKAPKQVAPGVRRLEGQYKNDLGQVEPWTAHYDEFGRITGRTDYTAGNVTASIPPTHHHIYEYGPGFSAGREAGAHLPGSFLPPTQKFPAR